RPLPSVRSTGFSIEESGATLWLAFYLAGPPLWRRITVNATEITRESKSNLALAFVSLGRERRRDMTTLYAFCRVVDDIVDTGTLSPTEKQAQLTKWRSWLRASSSDEPVLARELRALLAKYRLPPEMLDQIITGVEMDLHKA